jgi:hypothetical protein
MPKQTLVSTATATYCQREPKTTGFTTIIERKQRVSQKVWWWRQTPLTINESTFDTQTNHGKHCHSDVLFSLPLHFRIANASQRRPASLRSKKESRELAKRCDGGDKPHWRLMNIPLMPKQTMVSAATATFYLVYHYAFVLPTQAKDDRHHYEQRKQAES